MASILVLPPTNHPRSPPQSAAQRSQSNALFHKKIPTQQRLDLPLLTHQSKTPHFTTPSLFRDCPPDSDAYLATMSSCDSMELAAQIHAHAVKSGFVGCRAFLETKLVELYGRCGGYEDARKLFEEMPLRNVYSWVAVLSACVGCDRCMEAALLFERLIVDELALEFFVFPVILKACGGLGASDMGGQVHGLAIKEGFASNAFVGNALIDMYGKCGMLGSTLSIFDKMLDKDVVSWNSVIAACAANCSPFEGYEFLKQMIASGDVMPNLISWSTVISGFSQNGNDDDALELLRDMQEFGVQPNAQTLASVLPACGRSHNLKFGQEIHGYVIRHNFVQNAIVANGLLDVYRRCGDMDNALKIFSLNSARNLVSFNTMIVGYNDIGDTQKAEELFDTMGFHGIIRDVISWNAMISGYVGNGQFTTALEMFKIMQMEEGILANPFTLGSTLASCAGMTSLCQGKEIHSFAIVRGLHHDPVVGGALIDMYSKCEDLASAEMVFEKILERDIASWNALISGFARYNKMDKALALLFNMRMHGLDPNVYTWNGLLAGYVENGYDCSCIELFVKMQMSGVDPDVYSMGLLLSACVGLASIQIGKQAHAYLIKLAWDSHVHIGSSLVDMYAKCGTIKDAKRAFSDASTQNLITYNTMLAGLAMNGLCNEAISLFQRLISDGLKPDAVSFLSILSACTHEGNVEEGSKFFNLMSRFNVKPELKHYTCMVDLLSRVGSIDEAYQLVQTMPMEPDAVIWGALLNGCIIHKNLEIGELVANRLIDIDEGNAANYVMLANLYASLGRNEEFAEVRQLLSVSRMKKVPGCSWIEDLDQVHVFVAGDRSHYRTREMYGIMDILNLHMKNAATVQ